MYDSTKACLIVSFNTDLKITIKLKCNHNKESTIIEKRHTYTHNNKNKLTSKDWVLMAQTKKSNQS